MPDPDGSRLLAEQLILALLLSPERGGGGAFGEPAPGNGCRFFFEKDRPLCPNTLMPKFYFGENAGRPVDAGNHRFTFMIVGIVAGTHQGVIEVPDDKVDIFLSVAARVVQEISAEEHAAYLEKKKRPTRLESYGDLRGRSHPGPPLKGRGAVVIDGTKITREEEKKAPSTIDEAITLGTGDSVPDSAPLVRSTRRENHRQKRGFEQ